ncbi:hypothetical protein D3C76_1702590 [compost metagenome]
MPNIRFVCEQAARKNNEGVPRSAGIDPSSPSIRSLPLKYGMQQKMVMHGRPDAVVRMGASLTAKQDGHLPFPVIGIHMNFKQVVFGNHHGPL